MKVGDMVKWRGFGPAQGKFLYCIVTSADDRYVTLTNFPQNQVFQIPGQHYADGTRRPSPLELISESW